MKPRSPIEMMVDKACGFDRDAPEKNRITDVADPGAQTLMNVGDAAIAWLMCRQNGNDMYDAERVLAECAAELKAAGW